MNPKQAHKKILHVSLKMQNKGVKDRSQGEDGLKVFSKGQIITKIASVTSPPEVRTEKSGTSQPQDDRAIDAKEEMERQELEHQKSLASPSDSGKGLAVIRKSDLKTSGNIKVAISNEERAKVLQRIKVQQSTKSSGTLVQNNALQKEVKDLQEQLKRSES